MRSKTRKHLFAWLRILVCVGLLWFVARGVTIQDRVVLADGRGEVVGRIIDQGDRIEIVRTDGAVEHFPKTAIAVDAAGDQQMRPRLLADNDVGRRRDWNHRGIQKATSARRPS